MTNSHPVALGTTKPDTERAAEIRSKLEAVLEPVCRMMDEIVASGFSTTFSMGPDYRGRHNITAIKILKEFP